VFQVMLDVAAAVLADPGGRRRPTLHALDQCKDNDGPYNTTLFASFPYTK
jgi:hypothetical protein